MPRVITKEEMVPGAFDGGQILERRVVIPEKSQALFPFSNLVYWAYAWSEKGGLIGLHPHKGFEIVSIVIESSLEHYDTLLQKWLPVGEGGAQVIRSGKGISHSERLLPGARMFQIWFDPNVARSLSEPASYQDFSVEDFPVSFASGMKVTRVSGGGSPLDLAGGVRMEKWEIQPGNHQVKLPEGYFWTAFVLKGELLSTDFRVAQEEAIHLFPEESEIFFTTSSDTVLFWVGNPAIPDYPTYFNTRSN